MTVLLLAGTGDARLIAQKLVDNEIKAIASLAGETRQPLELACQTRVGGFGGQGGLRDFILCNGITAVIDATHPFAAQMSHAAAAVCHAMDLPHIQVMRPEWQAGPADHWVDIKSEAGAAVHIPNGATVFLATGRKTLHAFENLTGRTLICRRIDTPSQAFPFANGRYLVSRPPFSVADETALFLELGIDWLVVKNSGGQASRTKLDAARDLGIKVAMIARPAQPDCQRVTSVDQALDWVRQLKAGA